MSIQASVPLSDSLRVVLREVFRAPEYEWDVPRHPLQFLIDLWERSYSWLRALEADHPGAYYVLIGTLSAVLIAILVHFGYLMSRALRSKAAARESPAMVVPSELYGPDWYIVEARRLAGRGLYAAALSHRFRALVLQLDRRRVVRFHPSKTPAEYALEAELGEALRRELADLVMDLYRHLFGGVPCDEESVERFDQRAASLARDHAAH